MLMMPAAHAENDHIADTVVQSYFTALKSGDIETIKTLAGGKLLKQIVDLLEHNKHYSRFLRNHYKRTKFNIVNVSYLPSAVIIKAEYVFGVNDILNYKLVIKQQNSLWKIVNTKSLAY